MMMEHTTQLSRLLKSGMKAQGLTQKQLAKRLSVSEPTIKRWLRGSGLSLQQCLRLLESLNLSLADLAAMVTDSRSEKFTYSAQQEASLAETPGLLAFLQALLLGKTPAQIRKQHSLSEASLTHFLKKLDNIGLIEWGSGSNAKLLVHGEPEWRKQGALAKKFRQELIEKFLGPRQNEACFRLGIYFLSKEDRQEISAQLGEVFTFAQKAEKRAKLMHLKTESTCLATCADAFAPDFLTKIPDSRTKP